MPQTAAFILAKFTLEGSYVAGPKWKMFNSSQRRRGYPANTLGHAPYQQTIWLSGSPGNFQHKEEMNQEKGSQPALTLSTKY